MEDFPLAPEIALLKRSFDQKKLNAWCSGQTGWPLVDACMRYLHHHSWINFRMRAMLVSAATYSLSLPWRSVAHWLAQLFVDCEPGIHYPQIQMQSGTAGGTVLRIYYPLTQARTLDADGIFVKTWVPELRNVSHTWLFQPWKMTPNLHRQVGWIHEAPYGSLLVDFEVAHREAKAEISELRAAHSAAPDRGFRERNAPTGKRSTRVKTETTKGAKSLPKMTLF